MGIGEQILTEARGGRIDFEMVNVNDDKKLKRKKLTPQEKAIFQEIVKRVKDVGIGTVEPYPTKDQIKHMKEATRNAIDYDGSGILDPDGAKFKTKVTFRVDGDEDGAPLDSVGVEIDIRAALKDASESLGAWAWGIEVRAEEQAEREAEDEFGGDYGGNDPRNNPDYGEIREYVREKSEDAESDMSDYRSMDLDDVADALWDRREDLEREWKIKGAKLDYIEMDSDNFNAWYEVER